MQRLKEKKKQETSRTMQLDEINQKILVKEGRLKDTKAVNPQGEQSKVEKCHGADWQQKGL